MATVTRTGVKYIKVSKTDALGNNYDNSWRLNQSITLNYSDIGPTKYNVTTVTEYSNYWLLGLDYVNTTSSILGAKNYKLSASLITDPVIITGGELLKPVQFQTIIDSAGYFQDDTTYVFGVTPNIPIQITASFQVKNETPASTTPVTASVVINDSVEFKQSESLAFNGVASFIFNLPAKQYNAGTQIYFQIENNGSQPVVLRKTVGAGKDTFLTVTQSTAPASDTLTILNPFFTSPFEGTDCDVTYGWVQSYPYSQYYMDVDYSDSATIPINQQALISGTATPAPVKDYYYQTRRHTYPRYVGSKVTAQVINEYTDGDISYGKEPIINVGQAYFSYFNYIYGVSPEINGVIAADIKYTIDQLGNIYSPGVDSELVNTLKQNYPEGSKASVELIGETNQAMSTYLNREFTVYRAGAKVKPIIYSQTSSLGFTGSITFNPSTTSPKSYRMWADQTTLNIINGNSSLNPIIFNNEVYDDATYYEPSTGLYSFAATPLARINVGADIYVENNSTIDTQVQLIIYKNNTAILPSQITSFPAQTADTISVSSQTGIEFVNGDIVKVGLINYGTIAITASQGTFYTQQIGLSGSATAIAPFFLSGSSGTTNVLTCSLDLYKKLGNPQADITSSGFNPIVDDFTFRVGDQLRFQNDESKTHTITAIGNPTTLYGPTLTITPSLISGSNIDFFLLRRFDDSTNTVLLVGGKPSGGTSAGTLTPKYLSEALQKGTSTIIADLSSKNLI
jgi:hypothetical protein